MFSFAFNILFQIKFRHFLASYRRFSCLNDHEIYGYVISYFFY